MHVHTFLKTTAVTHIYSSLAVIIIIKDFTRDELKICIQNDSMMDHSCSSARPEGDLCLMHSARKLLQVTSV